MSLRFRVPTSRWRPTDVPTGTLADAVAVLRDIGSVVTLTGAGLSTDSGIPDYRGPAAPATTPMLYQEFVGSEANRRRYWARSYVGFARMGVAHPNAAHRALAIWETLATPRLVGVITQNVDGLHAAAGQTRLIDLHGRIADVVCLDCRAVSDRSHLQRRLAALNPDLDPSAGFDPEDPHAEMRPDGDAVVDDWAGFAVAACDRCGGILKPDVVFFGESAARTVVAQARAWADEAEALIVAGSSLTVMSGLRFVRQARRDGKPIVIINHGATRGDDLATVRLDARTGDALPDLVAALGA